jgi:divalent metal cation (Fe/Co/Zn/Cd) transporter
METIFTRDYYQIMGLAPDSIGLYSTGMNLTLVGIRCGLSLLLCSVALIADAIHSSTDVISSTTVPAGMKISRRKSKNFPYPIGYLYDR